MYIEYDIPTSPIAKKTYIDLKKSRLNLKSNGGGNKIERTSSPLVVVNPNIKIWVDDIYVYHIYIYIYILQWMEKNIRKLSHLCELQQLCNNFPY